MADILTVLIADRSRLAANLYRLLLAPLGVNLLIRQRCDHALAYLKTGAVVDLMIINANSIGSAHLDSVLHLFSDKRAARVKKIVIAGDSKSDEQIRNSIEKIAKTTFVERPFLPDDLLKTVTDKLAQGTS